jgi:hypothetical protein
MGWQNTEESIFGHGFTRILWIRRHEVDDLFRVLVENIRYTDPVNPEDPV